MAGNLSVLQKASPEMVELDPYPFIVLPNALPEDLYQALADNYPKPAEMDISTERNNYRWDYAAHKVRHNDRIPQIWRDFIAYHASQAFFDEIATLFYEGIHRLYPKRFPDRQSLTAYRAGVRNADTLKDHDILMDSMISGNTPVTKASSVRTSHLDRGNKLFSGLFYMRPEGYDAVGGDLTISRFKPGIPAEKRAWKFDGPYVDDRHLDVVRTVKYDRNLLVLFINSLDSVHGVTVRQPSPHSRLFVNLVGEVEPALYKVEKHGIPAHYLAADGADPLTGVVAIVKSRLQRVMG